MLQHCGAGVVILAGMTVAVLDSARPVQAAVETRAILKTYFQTGDVPTQQQFGTLIDSAVNIVDDRNLIGLKVYDPALIYLPGDTVVFNRLSIGDQVGALAEGTPTTPPKLEFAAWTPLDPNNPGEMDVATDFAGRYGFMGVQLRDSFGNINYGFLQMGMAAADGTLHPPIQVDYLVFESTPNAPITVFAVPEPGSLMVLGVGGIMTLHRRRVRVPERRVAAVPYPASATRAHTKR